MIVRLATSADIPLYITFAIQAQNWIRDHGLTQYVPAAHPAGAEIIATRVLAGSLFVIEATNVPIGLFSLERQPSPWWPDDSVPALYLAGMVVASESRGRGVGAAIITWCLEQARASGCASVRLDCHAGNPWLTRYYESHGFTLRGLREQHPGYFGCLYERML